MLVLAGLLLASGILLASVAVTIGGTWCEPRDAGDPRTMTCRTWAPWRTETVVGAIVLLLGGGALLRKVRADNAK